MSETEGTYRTDEIATPAAQARNATRRPVLPVDEDYWREITNWPPSFVLAVANAAFELAMEKLKKGVFRPSDETLKNRPAAGSSVLDVRLATVKAEVRRYAELADAAALMRDMAQERRSVHANTWGETKGGAFFGDWHAQEHLLAWLPIMMRELNRSHWMIDFCKEGRY
jgi:hypothetical protein